MKAILFALALSTFTLFAEGLPKDEEGNLDCPHLTISLNESQVEEIETLDTVTLTKQQWQEVRKSSPNTPKRLKGILPITHNDCTCGESFQAVQLSEKKLALFIEPQTPEQLAFLISSKESLTFRLDGRGQFYLDGILTRFPNLIAALKQSDSAPAEVQPDEPWTPAGTVVITIAPLADHDSSVYHGRIIQVAHLLREKGWALYGMGAYALQKN